MRFNTADEEMRAIYGSRESSDCKDCKHRDGKYCALTNKRRKCGDYGKGCGKFEESGRYKFVVK